MSKSETRRRKFVVFLLNAQLVYTCDYSAVSVSTEETTALSQNGTTDKEPDNPKRVRVGFCPENH